MRIALAHSIKGTREEIVSEDRRGREGEGLPQKACTTVLQRSAYSFCSQHALRVTSEIQQPLLVAQGTVPGMHLGACSMDKLTRIQ